MALCALLVSTQAFAADNAATEVSQIAKASSKPANYDTRAKLENQMQIYIREKRDSLPTRVKLYSDVAMVLVPTTSPDWVEQRSLAYEEAILNVSVKYIKEQQLEITNDTVKSMYQAADQVPPPYDKEQETGQAAELVRKILAVGNARADAELKKLGVDPKQYADAPESQKLIQLKNALMSKTIETSFGELVGLTPLQSFEGNDGEGNYAVGVVAAVSSGLRDFAQEVLTSKGDFTPDPSKALDLESVIGDEPALVPQFGVRRLFDKHGLPVIVSFAQWAPQGKSEDPATNDAYREVAVSQAESRADAQISNFLAGSAQFERESDTGKSLEKMAERLPDNTALQHAETKSIINGMMSELRVHSNIKLSGIETFKTWYLDHPVTGRPIVGVVRIWSAAGEKAMSALRESEPSAGTSADGKALKNGQAGVTSGADLMKASDF